MLLSWQEVALGRPIALHFIRDHFIRDQYARGIPQALEQLVEELLCHGLMATSLHENVQYMTILIDCQPQIMTFALDRQKHLIEMPLIPGLRPAVAQLLAYSWPNLRHHLRIAS
jgi:hypothetical protein